MNTLSYLFRPIPGSEFDYYIPFAILGVLLILAGFAAMKYLHMRKEDKALRRVFTSVPTHAFWTGFLILMNLGARYERFPLVGSRFVLFLTLAFLVYSIVKHAIAYQKKLPEVRAQMHHVAPQGQKYTTAKYRK